MEQTRNLTCRVERLSPAEGHYFFGYYDVPAWSDDEEYHLCHKVDFWDRLPEPGDVAILGLIRVSDRQFVPFADTTAWNFQQGSMLQWLPGSSSSSVVFNRRLEGQFVGVVRDVWTGAENVLERAIAAVSPQGDQALAVNFSRLFDFRPGYGYAGIQDPFTNEPHPREDGLFVVDLASGLSKLILSMADIGNLLGEQAQGKTLLINHVAYNTDGTRVLCLVRDNPRSTGNTWSTSMLTLDADGGNICCLHQWGFISHYHWRDPAHVVCYCSPGGQPGLYLITDRTGEAELVDADFFTSDGHCSYSPDRRRLLYDSYPSREGYRRLYVYDLDSRTGRLLGEFLSPPTATTDIRADLHPRWSPSGRWISFDSTHEGYRAVYLIDITA